MEEKISLKDFDILGVIILKDVKNIEKYVTPILNEDSQETGLYFSRSKEYYNVKTLTELSTEREELKKLLTRMCTKRNFTILENMLNCSGKVYFKKFESYILNPNNSKIKEELEIARKCLLEDTENIVKILDGKNLITVNPNYILPTGSQNSEKRAIEMDNKAMLYLFGKTLKLETSAEQVQILTPGYGSLYIGPFLKAMHGYDFTNLLKSKYVQETIKIEDKTQTIKELLSNNKIFEQGKTIVILDDNIGTGQTMSEIEQSLKKEGIKNCITGAVQFNWRNYYKISIGEKLGIDRFDVNQFDILSPINYAGHKLYKHAIDTLHSSSTEYIEYLNSKSYRIDNCSDIYGALHRGIKCAKRTGLILDDTIEIEDSNFSLQKLELSLDYNNGINRKIRPQAKKFISEMVRNVKILEEDKNIKDKNIEDKNIK